MSTNSKLTLKFRCPTELDGLIPAPIPAAQGVPDWLKAMPATAFSSINLHDEDTIKRCPPFVDAMTCGFLLPLVCDLKVEDGEITWDQDLPPGGTPEFPRSPIGFHDPGQVTGTPLFEEGRFFLKFHNLWTVEAPEGYAIYFTHPVNRFDLPFTTLSGLVNSDLYADNWVHFPAYWHDRNFRGVLPKGDSDRAMHSRQARRLDRAGIAVHRGGRQAGRRTPHRAQTAAEPLPEKLQGVRQGGMSSAASISVPAEELRSGALGEEEAAVRSRGHDERRASK
ncbi:uncharacterized protein YoaH (UPF0181 family) [Bradyrhizobium elkanii]